MAVIHYFALDLEDRHRPTIAQTFGENVRSIRLEQQMSVAELSRMCGIGRPLLSKIEKGTADVRLSYVKRLADFLCVSPAELITPQQRDPSKE